MLILGAVATILTIFAFLPQTYKALKTRKTRDLSLATYTTLIVTGTLWTIYGIGLNDFALIITNTVVASLSLMIVVTKLIDKD